MTDMAPWKKELFQLAGDEEESEIFQKGVIAGYHDAGTALATGQVHPIEEVEKWARGFVAGYKVRLFRAREGGQS